MICAHIWRARDELSLLPNTKGKERLSERQKAAAESCRLTSQVPAIGTCVQYGQPILERWLNRPSKPASR